MAPELISQLFWSQGSEEPAIPIDSLEAQKRIDVYALGVLIHIGIQEHVDARFFEISFRCVWVYCFPNPTCRC